MPADRRSCLLMAVDSLHDLIDVGAPPAFHLLAKPTGAVCNLDCSYCFFLSKEMLYPGSRFRMADELLETYVRQLVEAQVGAPVVEVAWQGGEPTLMDWRSSGGRSSWSTATCNRATARPTRSRPTAPSSTPSGRPSSASTTCSSGSRSTARARSTTPPRDQGRPRQLRPGDARPRAPARRRRRVQRLDDRPRRHRAAGWRGLPLPA